MGVTVRKNERSWAIVIISEIRIMLQNLNIKIKSVGGESTLSENKKSMFPDVLLYEDEAQTKILQGWELKMPDVAITDDALIKDATRKALTLGLNSFVIYNFTYGKLYVKNENGYFEEAKVWKGTEHIKTREDVATYKTEWLPVIKNIILTVNEYLVKGDIVPSTITETISDGLMTEVIRRNEELVAEHLIVEVSKNMPMESRIKVWWNSFHREEEKSEREMFSAYARSILLNWTNRIMCANLIKKYHNCAYLIENINNSVAPEEGNQIINEIIEQGDFYNVFNKLDFNEIIPEDTWIDIVDYNQFLIANNIEYIDQSILQDILEKTVDVAKREVRGQYSTPYKLADILCQITVEDWNKGCADLCAGTGTIAKAILNNKIKRLKNVKEAFETTWVADKYAYPLQIANMALTSADALNIPLNMFQSDAFEVEVGKEIILRSPKDGKEFTTNIPRFHSIVSNLPFVKYNNNSYETRNYLEKYRKKILNETGINLTKGKTDIYNYLPFKLYDLLEEDGKLGIILSNSWLGSDVGNQFFEALLYYYKVDAVIISGIGKWFKNADVIATMMILRKKKLSEPNEEESINIYRTDKKIEELSEKEVEDLINTVVLGQVQNDAILCLQKFSFVQLKEMMQMGICLNSCVHNLDWLEELKKHLVPITEKLKMVRGERTGHNKMFYLKEKGTINEKYLVPMLKTSRSVKGFKAKPDMWAFCCDDTIEELKAADDEGTLSWIRRFADENFEPIPKSINYNPWYQMPKSNRADIVLSENPDKRLFIAELDESVLVDQRLIAMKYINDDESRDLIFALLNSLYGMFAIEANGFGRGQGVLDISKTRFESVYMIDPDNISEEDSKEIVKLFQAVSRRKVLNVEEEFMDADREAFDRKVLRAIKCEHLYDDIKNSILSMQKTRHTL